MSRQIEKFAYSNFLGMEPVTGKFYLYMRMQFGLDIPARAVAQSLLRGRIFLHALAGAWVLTFPAPL